jgi:predicted ATPase/class 3 adenylate cyclase
MRADLPKGTVTFLLTDVEGSTKLLHELGAEAYADALAEHRRIVRQACTVEGGVEVDTQGDSFFFAFSSAPRAVSAAQAITDALAPGPITLRIGLHTGTPLVTDEGYVGDDVHFAARVAAAGHGGQVLLSKVSREFVDGLAIADLGEHRLKDIEGAVSIYQLGQKTFPPLRTISNTNLPRPASSFVGREREREEVVSEIRGGARLLTLTGPGGSGKTRLALEVASELVAAFKAGVFWVDLSALRDPELVTQTIGQTLGAKDGLTLHVGERELLLLLDNFEQIVEAAPGLSQLLEACPHLSLIVTSRERLRIRGEVEYPVSPLAEPEAVELFCERARLNPDETIAELCRRLDDMPLALELAAARSRVLTPAQILDRLSLRLDLLKGGRDADPRQQTLRATIEWSHDMLTEDEQQLFARLAIFTGGSTLDAVEAVCDAGLDVLQSLVDKSLLRHIGDRYWMLETIREFSLEQFRGLPDAGHTCELHARWYAQLAKSAYAELRGPSHVEWLVRLDRELENLRSAIHWVQEHDPDLEVELAGATWFFLSLRGFLREALGYLEHAIETANNAPSLDQSELLYGGAYVALRTGDYAAVKRWSEQRLELGRARGDAPVIARSLVGLAHAATAEGDLERGRTLFGEAATVARDCGETLSLWMAVQNLGNIALSESDPDAARLYYRQSLELSRALSDEHAEAGSLANLGWLALLEDDNDEAATLLGDSLRLTSSIGDMEGILICLYNLAVVAAQRGESFRAARLLGAADALREEIGFRHPDLSEQETLMRIASVLDKSDPTLVEAQSEGRALPLDKAVAYALGEPG